jgi:hypothetical protein
MNLFLQETLDNKIEEINQYLGFEESNWKTEGALTWNAIKPGHDWIYSICQILTPKGHVAELYKGSARDCSIFLNGMLAWKLVK